jgi:hypothetical protein
LKIGNPDDQKNWARPNVRASTKSQNTFTGSHIQDANAKRYEQALIMQGINYPWNCENLIQREDKMSQHFNKYNLWRSSQQDKES